MCFGNDRTTSTTTSTVPNNIKELTDKIATKAGGYLDAEYTPYDGERVADLSQSQQQAIGGIGTLAGNQPIDRATNTATGMISQSGRQPATRIGPSNISTPNRIIDESGPLGAISDYMNPYVDQVLGNTVGRLDESAQKARNQIGASATMAGAFGDSRNGVENSSNQRNLMDAVKSAAGSAYSGAYNSAMQQRNNDQTRMTGAETYNADANRSQDVFNAQQGEREADRLYRSGVGVSNAANTQQQTNLDTLSALMGAGRTQQSNDQARLDADYEGYLRQQQYPFDVLGAVTGAASGIPYERSQVTRQPDNSGYGILGSIASSLF